MLSWMKSAIWKTSDTGFLKMKMKTVLRRVAVQMTALGPRIPVFYYFRN